jgi:GT2 family glycosyltransferase
MLATAVVPAPQRTEIFGKLLYIILSFNGYDDTAECLDSLLTQKTDAFDLLVIDNASSGDVAEKLKAQYPTTEIIALSENLGWAGGNNFGIKLALERKYAWVCLLNNDTVFPAGEVEKWTRAVLSAPACLLHPTIYYWDDPEVAQLDASGRLDGSQNDSVEAWHDKILMDRAYGACLAVPTDIFRTVGTFDDRFFLQLEETDFHQRAVLNGFRAACQPNVKIFHKESRAFGSKRSPVKVYYIVRNTLLIIGKNNAKSDHRLGNYKKLYWTISHIAASEFPNGAGARFLLPRWLLSRYPSAIATRMGLRDFL